MRISMLVVLAAMVSALPSCDGAGSGAVGAPCNTADDCDGSLICDEHNGQASCQEPHGHGETDASSGSEETGHSHDTDHGHDTDHEGTGSSSSGTTGTGDAESTDGGTTGTGETTQTETTGSSELCEAFCGCMETTCSSYDAYPYANPEECMTACEAFDDATLSCFGGFCQQASDAEGTIVEHYCEHAWGELGDEKC